MAARDFIESRADMEQILQEETVGYLGLSLKDEPYVLPLNYAYQDGVILFHCALAGRKLDYLRANPRICFTVARQSAPVKRHEEGDPCTRDRSYEHDSLSDQRAQGRRDIPVGSVNDSARLPCHGHNISVICYGRARIVEELDERHELLNRFLRSFTPDAESISREDTGKCAAVEITVDLMTGRREQEGEVCFFRQKFDE